MKEQLLAHKYRLVPSGRGEYDSQSGSNGMEQEMIKLVQQARHLGGELSQLKRKLDDEVFKNTRKHPCESSSRRA